MIGIIVAKSISNNLRYATSVVPDVHLFEYECSFGCALHTICHERKMPSEKFDRSRNLLR